MVTERKPPGLPFESWVDKQVREGAQRGLFDNLSGTGEPLPQRHEPPGAVSWLRNKMREEGLESDALLPPQLRLRKEIERLPETVRTVPTERAVRDVVADLNRRIAECARESEGPAVSLRPVNPDDVVRHWQVERGDTPVRSGESYGESYAPGRQVGKTTARTEKGTASRPRWRRLRRRRPGR